MDHANEHFPLRVFHDAGKDGETRELCALSLTEFARRLTAAQSHRSSWIKDFADDEILISIDLYELLLAITQKQASDGP